MIRMLVFLLMVLQFLPAYGQVVSTTTRSDHSFFFDKDLQLNTIHFRGVQAEHEIGFPYPRSWQNQPGSAIDLCILHSSALDPELSELVITLNGMPLRTVALDRSNIGPVDVLIPLNSVQLKDYNRLNFRVVQHYTRDCENPFHSSLWTEISSKSSLRLNYKVVQPVANLQNWPFPFFDTCGLGKQTIGLEIPTTASSVTATWLQFIARNLGAIADYRPLEFVLGSNGVNATIVIGTPLENPMIAKLDSSLPLPLIGGRFVDTKGNVLPNDHGVLELIAPNKLRSQWTLVVSGNSPVGVEQAAKALVGHKLDLILGGKVAIVKSVQVPNDDNNYPKSGMIPNNPSFNFRTIGFKSTTVHGCNTDPIIVDANSLPGLEPMGTHQSLRLVFAYGAQINHDLSSLEVKLNGLTLRSYALNNNNGEEHHEDIVEIPNDIFACRNRFEFVFHLFPKFLGPCLPMVDDHLWATLYDTTRLNLDHECIAKVPNLSLLQYNGFPFAQGNHLAFVLPNKPSATCLFALSKLSCQLGRWGYPSSSLNYFFENSFWPSDDIQSDKYGNLIVLSSGNQNKFLETLNSMLTFQKKSGANEELNAWTASKLNVNEDDPNGYLEEVLLPNHSGRLALVCSGKSDNELNQAIDGLLDPNIRYQLKGSLASISPQGIIKCAQTTQPINFGNMMPWRFLTAWMSDNVWLAPLLLLLALVPLVLLLLKAIRSKKQ